MTRIASIPDGNLLKGVITSITTDSVTGEVSYSPSTFFPVGTTVQAIIPYTTAFAVGNTVTCMVKATAMSIMSL
ncbi:hypothetical protein SOV_08290 [Sporomusa ovata DSM 2662]|uniref:Uncharacterized protein n=1 Tax=Sporomusa ovata TaxID=2378 RepID=A0A0U1L5M8_9FIRM|nr:hypothetical protein [Sporomusa ovata]EQB28481.1 hypothetical protein SOV_1c01670 [Sporomusa ovata DSM 2662]CQR74805.1 hypothetical protein SpAn4DRAFT_4162 [Sporomusa ovata]